MLVRDHQGALHTRSGTVSDKQRYLLRRQRALGAPRNRLAVWSGAATHPVIIIALGAAISAIGIPATREESIHSLGRIGAGARDAVAALRKALENKKDVDLRPAVAETLWRITGENRLTVTTLINVILTEGASQTGLQAFKSLGRMEGAASGAVPVLLMTLQDDNLRPWAAQTLKKIDPVVAIEAGLQEA